MAGNNKKCLTPAQLQAKKAKAKARRQKQKAKAAMAKASSAPISTGVKVKGETGRTIREQGTDQLATTSVSTEGIIGQYVVVPGLFPRLSQLAKSFQRIKYHRLRFEIVTGCPTVTGGVYVAGFVADATDPVSKNSAAATLLASGGSATKFWQSSEVIVNKFGPELYYTNPHEGEERWSSPGSLVLAVVSPPTQPVSFDIFCHWDVSLSKPTYDAPGKTEENFSRAEVDIYTSKDNKYLSKRKGTDWTPLRMSDFTPSLKNETTYILGGWRCGTVEASTGAASGIFGFFGLRVKYETDNYYVYPVDESNNRTTQNFHAEEYVIRKGELVFRLSSLSDQQEPWYQSQQNQLCTLASKSMSSRFPWTSPEYWQVIEETPELPTLEPSGNWSKTNTGESTGAQSSVKSLASSSLLAGSSTGLSHLEPLLPLLENLTGYLQNLSVSSREAPSGPSSEEPGGPPGGFEVL